MAQVLAVFEFDDRSTAEAAFNKIRSQIGYGVNWSGTRVEIDSDCSNPSTASQICSAYGGRAI